ncbi:polysaccharide deacetylase family protein [Vreelandella utahensis]|uniref:polysaccharide deacetylase family protein n=1 Tax=Vreelandella halophila TaxID=86177 RepID=UPI00098468B5|nr:polysaccharide deacetylase family protein [Halomonas utahensis]
MTRVNTLTRIAATTAMGLGVASSVHAGVATLAYHHVSTETPPSTTTSPSLFRDQLALIEELGVEPLSLTPERVQKTLDGGYAESQRVALTFDDAYESVYTEAWPLLKEKGIPVTVFVLSGSVGDNGYMTWDELREMAEHDLVTIGNHSLDHGTMLQRPDESAEEHAQRIALELDRGAERIEEKIGVETELYAHPYGEFSEPVLQALEERGWYGFAQHSGVIGEHSHPGAMPRFAVADAYGGIDTLGDKLQARNFPVDRTNLPDPVINNDNPPLLDMTVPEGWDSGRLSCFASGEGMMELESETVANGVRIQARAQNPIEARRSRYNCTYPAGNGRFYWLSQPWFNPEAPEG